MNSDPIRDPAAAGSRPGTPEVELPQVRPRPPEGHAAVSDETPQVGETPEAAEVGREPAGAPVAPEAAEVGREAAEVGREPAEAAVAPAAAEAFALAGTELEALTEKAGKADEYLQLAQRTKADFENYRKRTARDAAVAQERGAAKLAQALLPAVDNLERALAHAPQNDADDGGFLSGIKHVHSDLVAALQRAGIERYSPEGEPFDPTLHEAVAQQPVEGYEPGTVVEVFQRGYRMGDSVVRPARVVVSG